MLFFKRKFLFIISGLILFSFISCKSDGSLLQKKYGNDSFYFQGLKALEANDEKEAERFFRKSIKSGTTYTSRRSAEELTRMGNVQQRLSACEYLVENFYDEQSLLLSAMELDAAKEYTKILTQTEKIDISTANNQLVRLRIKALEQNKDLSLQETVYNWIVKRPYSQEHYKFYRENVDFLENPNQSIVQDFRNAVYIQNYQSAFLQIPKVIQAIEIDLSLQMEPQILSDMGKACLYGSTDWIKNAEFFSALAEQAIADSNTENAFFGWFYSARCYEKTGYYYTLSSRRYVSAMENAATPEQFDNALWYLLNLDLGRSTELAIQTLQEYCSKWNNSLYFEDFFDTLSVLLISGHKWDAFYKVYTIIKDYADDSICAKYAYLSGRLIETKRVKVNEGETVEEESRLAYLTALNSGTNLYYKVLAIERLNLSDEEIEKVFLSNSIETTTETNKDAETFLLGLGEYGFPQRIYSEWERLFLQKVPLSRECLTAVSGFIQNCGEQIPDYMYKSLRIASLAVNQSSGALSKDLFELAYPKYYQQFVEDSCNEFAVKESFMYGLVRSESFFDADIQSSAGAIGLSQLMQSTGADIAKRLKIDEYDLTDAQTSIRFGAYYLDNLTGRLDSSLLLAAFAYNSGITRVRRWLSNSKAEFETRENPPLDLFLETIPFAETREYGRKIISAAAMYNWLYFQTSPIETVREFLK